MIDMIRPESLQSKEMMQGWGVSLLLHLGLVFIAVTVVPKMTVVIEQKPFRWDVALVESSREILHQEVASQMAQVQPPQPTKVQPVRPVEPPPEKAILRVAPQQSPQMIHPVSEQPKPEQPIQPVQQVVRMETEPVEPQEVKKEEVRKPEPVAKEVAAVVEPAAPAYTHHAPVAEPSPPIVEPRLESVAVASAPPVSASEPAPASSTPSPVATPPGEPAAVAAVPMAPEQPPVIASAAPPRPVAKADYAWLAESLGRRIAALTHYPSSARLNGWEGKVVLKAVIRADGHLGAVTVHRSSGHEVLDRAAIETIKLACPLHMQHALRAAEVAVYVPIVYSLAG